MRSIVRLYLLNCPLDRIRKFVDLASRHFIEIVVGFPDDWKLDTGPVRRDCLLALMTGHGVDKMVQSGDYG